MNIHLTSYGQGIPLVFFHGWGFDSQIWLPLVPELKAFYHVILVDLPGFGLTSMMDWFEFKTKLLASLPHQFALVGWSMGGLYSMRLALEEPERVNYLLNIATSPRFLSDNLWPGLSKEVLFNFYNKLLANTDDALSEFTMLQSMRSNVHFARGNPPSQLGLELGLEILNSWDLREGLKHLQQPTCFIFGRLDPITPIKVMYTMELLYPHFKYSLFKKSAHMPFLSHPSEFFKALLGFIQ